MIQVIMSAVNSLRDCGGSSSGNMLHFKRYSKVYYLYVGSRRTPYGNLSAQRNPDIDLCIIFSQGKQARKENKHDNDA